jgi:hypothetical protein
MGEARRLCVGRINAEFVIRLARARAITSGQASDEESLKISGFDEQRKLFLDPFSIYVFDAESMLKNTKRKLGVEIG